ncbi:MAG: hypothetical protein HYS44_03860 [Candidatus Niyogibacteria bacterium]|nr:hypothetical protein [Candidatus Niyogibacteria bacterium]
MDTPSPSADWRKLLKEDRLRIISYALTNGPAGLKDAVVVRDAREDGQIIVDLTEPMSAAKRGTLLLDLEEFLKEAVDPGLVVWVMPQGDLNTLRHFRGVEVKA